MGLRDDDFPGRNDKLIWVLMLLVFAPVDPWLFPLPPVGPLAPARAIARSRSGRGGSDRPLSVLNSMTEVQFKVWPSPAVGIVESDPPTWFWTG